MRIIDMKYKFVAGRGGLSTAFTGISVWSMVTTHAIINIDIRLAEQMTEHVPRSCALPKIYPRKCESSRPQTP